MACYRPVQAWRPLDGGPILFSEKKNTREITIKCGQCIGCRIEKQEMWMIRCLAESKCHPVNSFVTLTYSDDNLPANESLNYGHFQLFMKRLRKVQPKILVDGKFIHKPIRFFMCGEYGEKENRPHYHALLFGCDFPDRVVDSRLPSDYDIYRSAVLEKLWPYGYSTIGEVNATTARYCATYALKKVTGEKAEEHYTRCTRYGEIVSVVPEFVQMSLKPGIGEPWLRKYWRDLYAVHDAMIVDGKKRKVPRYFDEKMDEISPLLMDHIEFERFNRASAHRENNSPERLAVREKVEKARVNFNKERSNRNAL